MKSDYTLIQNKEDWEKFYWYEKEYLTESKYPKKYPCIAKKEHEDCGLMGSAYYHYIIYLPENFEKMDKTDLVLKMFGAESECIG